MLIKDKIIFEEDIEHLEHLLAGDLNPVDEFLIQRELHALEPDKHGGKNARDYLNFYFEESPYWAVIHDLRFEQNGHSAQIDHILINRAFDVHILDSKNYSYPIKITADGGFLVFDGHRYLPVDSPLDQIQNHLQLLQDALFENEIIPRRLGVSLRPSLQPFILMSPKSDVLRPPEWILDTGSVIKADQLADMLLKKPRWIRKAIQNLTRFPKFYNTRTFLDIAQKLARLHRPVHIDYSHRFNRPTQDEAGDHMTRNREAASACEPVT